MVFSEPEPLAPLLTALRDLVGWLQAYRVPYAIVGGVAASLLGRPRLTRDVDTLVWLDEDRWRDFLALGPRFGYNPRRRDAIAFARETRVLLVRHQPSAIDADIIFAAIGFEQKTIARAVTIDVGGLLLKLPTPEDLIVLKAVAHRTRDLADIESILDAHPELNLRRVRQWVRGFSIAMEMPDILNDLEAILGRRRKRPKGK